MKSNSNITIYNKYYDKITRMDSYQKTIIKDVYFEENNAVKKDKSGFNVNDNAFILIPFSCQSYPERVYIKPKNFISEEDKSTYFTLASADLIIRGDGPDFISVKDLQNNHEVYTIVAVDTCDYGREKMHHWEVTAK